MAAEGHGRSSKETAGPARKFNGRLSKSHGSVNEQGNISANTRVLIGITEIESKAQGNGKDIAMYSIIKSLVKAVLIALAVSGSAVYLSSTPATAAYRHVKRQAVEGQVFYQRAPAWQSGADAAHQYPNGWDNSCFSSTGLPAMFACSVN